MKKLLTALLLLILTVSTTSAREKSDLTGSLLWKISGNNLSQPSYILGTHHFIDVNFMDSIVGLETVIEKTNQVVGELLLDDKQALQMKMQEAATMPADISYSKLLSSEDYAILDNDLKALFGVGLDQFGKLKPAMISLLYSVTIYTQSHPEFNPMTHEAIDEYLQKVGKENNKSVIGLETVDDQIYALFEAESMKDQVESLVCSINNSESTKESSDLLDKYYRSGNLSEMYKLAFDNPKEPCPISQTQQAAFLKNRNDNWLKQLPKIMKDESNLIVVGALHLAGEEGLLNQLEEMGYTVEAVK